MKQYFVWFLTLSCSYFIASTAFAGAGTIYVTDKGEKSCSSLRPKKPNPENQEIFQTAKITAEQLKSYVHGTLINEDANAAAIYNQGRLKFCGDKEQAVIFNTILDCALNEESPSQAVFEVINNYRKNKAMIKIVDDLKNDDDSNAPAVKRAQLVADLLKSGDVKQTMAALKAAASCDQKADAALTAVAIDDKFWANLAKFYSEFGTTCLDGYVAEGFVEKVAIKLSRDWKSISQFVKVGKKNPKFQAQVIKYLGGDNMGMEEGTTILNSAKTKCPSDSKSVCKLIVRQIPPVSTD